MRDEIIKLVNSLCRPQVEDGVLEVLCEAACRKLDGMLADGVSAKDCSEAYLPAAAWLVMDWLGDSQNRNGITALSAGDMTVRCEGGKSGRLEQRAMELMAPWLKDTGFVFRGVRG